MIKKLFSARPTLLIGAVPILLILGLFCFMAIRTIVITPERGETSPIDISDKNALADTIAKNLGAAIRIKTISWNTEAPTEVEAFDAFVAFLEETYPNAHRVLVTERINQSVLYKWTGISSEEKPIGFIAHMDVVPIEKGTEGTWSAPPFSGEIKDGAVWGRGALDDKGPLIAIMEAAERLSLSGFEPRRDIYFLFGHDEELGGSKGASAISEELDRRGVQFAWTLDEGSVLINGAIPGVDVPIALISTAEKGSTTLRLVASTEGGHSSAPSADTAVSLVAKAVIAVNDDPFPLKIDDNTTAFLHAIAPEVGFLQRVALTNLWLTGPIVKSSLGKDATIAATLRTTTAPTIIEGGEKVNILPQRASAIVNYRLHPRNSVEGVKARAERQINDPKITVELAGGVKPSPNSARDAEGFIKVSESVAAIFGNVPIAPSLTIGGTDTRHFTAISDNNYRFMPFTFETTDIKRLHGTNERVPVDDLVRATLWYEDLIQRAASQ